MPWMNMLYQTYEENAAMAGKVGESVPLSLVAHIIANAQLEIYINTDGEFKGANRIDKNSKEDRRTIIPVTEASASRASVTAPHPLCDMLPYVAGDFGKYLADEKAAAKADEKFRKYRDDLAQWANSDYTHPKVQAVFAYISKCTLMKDLILSGIVTCTAEGFLDNEKISGAAYEKTMVRFRVMNDSPEPTWEDTSLFDCYTSYYLSMQGGTQDICYLKGEAAPISVNHPKGIVAANYAAKLISSNDKTNFTYRGRFKTAQEACAVSYEATQKAHSALTWLAAKQGVTVGKQDKRTYICWNPKGKEVLNPAAELFQIEQDDAEPTDKTEAEYQKRFLKTLNGYRNKLDDNDDIVIITLDAATTGRLAVTYYNELKSSDFYDRIALWGRTCCWDFDQSQEREDKKTGKKLNRKPDYIFTTPFTSQIINCAFGVPRNGLLETDDKVMKEQSQRIYHCIIDTAPVPHDITQALFRQASHLQLFSEKVRRRVLFVACAMIAKRYYDENNRASDKEKGEGKGEKRIMSNLDTNSSNRDYLFGRLLAVMEEVERLYLVRIEDSRETNAMRLQAAFVNHPLTTYKVLYGKIAHCFRSMKYTKDKNKYRDLMDEIVDRLKIEEIKTYKDEKELNLPLNEMYLLGFHSQRKQFLEDRENNKKNKDKNAEEI